MPGIDRYGCDTCEFEFPTGWGGHLYAVSDTGERLTCGHPGEDEAIKRITGLDFMAAEAAGRLGFAEYAVCVGCLHHFEVDTKRDERRCPDCNNCEIATAREAVGKPCPQCRSGIIEIGSPTRWKLDPDWQQLPVPEIVKDLLEYTDKGAVSPSLQRANNAVTQIFNKDLVLLVIHTILDWWEGKYPYMDEPSEITLKSERLGRIANAVLEITPELSAFITCSGQSCRFIETLTTDTRRGITNYVRKHRRHSVMY